MAKAKTKLVKTRSIKAIQLEAELKDSDLILWETLRSFPEFYDDEKVLTMLIKAGENYNQTFLDKENELDDHLKNSYDEGYSEGSSDSEAQYDQGYEEGYNAGYKEGYAEAIEDSKDK